MAGERSRAARIAAVVVCAAIALRIWHVLLLRRYLDEPLTVAVLLAFALAFATLAFGLSRAQVATGAAFAVLLFLFHWGYERAASDGREYFVQARSIVFDRDLDFANDSEVLGARGMAKIYPVGVALFWSPFIALAHGWLSILNLFGGDFGVDGYTNPYQRAVGLATLLYGFAGLVLVWRVVRDYFGDALASFSLVALVAGTFVLWYLVVESSMSHGVSLFATALFLYVWHRGRRAQETSAEPTMSSRWWLVFGFTAGLMVIVRWQNVLWAFVPLLSALAATRPPGVSRTRAMLLFASAAFVAVLPQLYFWKVVRGGWLSLPAGDHAWDPGALHLADVLFSSNHGLLSVTPLALFAIAGIPLLFRRDRVLTMALLAGVAGQVLANAATDTWWGGPGFGARRFENCLLAFAMGLSALLHWIRSRPLVAPAVIVSGFVLLNAALMIDVRRGDLRPADAITFEDMATSVYKRVGNPFAWPYSAIVAWQHDADWSLYDRLRGRTFNNIEIDFGDGHDGMFLGHGWRPGEQTADGTYRLTDGGRATLVVPLKTAGDYELDVSMEPTVANGSQAIHILVNGREMRVLDAPAGMARYVVPIAAASLRAGLNRIQFESVAPIRFDGLKLRRHSSNQP